jgi:hypothetical protein
MRKEQGNLFSFVIDLLLNFCSMRKILHCIQNDSILILPIHFLQNEIIKILFGTAMPCNIINVLQKNTAENQLLFIDACKNFEK